MPLKSILKYWVHFAFGKAIFRIIAHIPIFQTGEEEEYDCEEEGVVYMHRKLEDAPDNYKEGKTDTWHECQKLCSKLEKCKGFTWHKKNNHDHPKGCSLFSTYGWKATGYWWTKTAVSGRKECPKKGASKKF